MPALQSSQVVERPGRYLRALVSVGMGCEWGLPSSRSCRVEGCDGTRYLFQIASCFDQVTLHTLIILCMARGLSK